MSSEARTSADHADPEDMELRRLALQLVAQLPAETELALRVLCHCKRLVRFMAGGSEPGDATVVTLVPKDAR